jgi:hypothetical protein
VSAVDPITQAWIRNASDVKAAAVGCRFNVERGSYTVFWVERYCRLYEGESFAGLPMILAGCHDCGTYDLPSAIELDEWEDPAKEVYAERWVPKKNKKSPTLAAWGLYLLCGDGEPGQKVFLAPRTARRRGRSPASTRGDAAAVAGVE